MFDKKGIKCNCSNFAANENIFFLSTNIFNECVRELSFEISATPVSVMYIYQYRLPYGNERNCVQTEGEAKF